MKKQTRHVFLMFYTLFISVKEAGGKDSKILRLLFPICIRENQFKIIVRNWASKVIQVEVFRDVAFVILVISSNHMIFLITKS